MNHVLIITGDEIDSYEIAHDGCPKIDYDGTGRAWSYTCAVAYAEAEDGLDVALPLWRGLPPGEYPITYWEGGAGNEITHSGLCLIVPKDLLMVFTSDEYAEQIIQGKA